MTPKMAWLGLACVVLASCGQPQPAETTADAAPPERNEVLAGARQGAAATAFVPIDGRFVEIAYANVNGEAVYGGDMIVGSHDSVQQASTVLRAAAGQGIEASDLAPIVEDRPQLKSALSGQSAQMRAALSSAIIGIRGFGPTAKRWPTKTIPYRIDASITNADLKTRIANAIADWNATGLVSLKPEADVSEEIRKKTNVLIFQDADGDEFSCAAHVGHQTNAAKQTVSLNPAWAGAPQTGAGKHGGCTKGNIVHELGHALGLDHEHMRDDRRTYLDVDATIQDSDANYGIIKTGEKHTDYDMCSIMHYGDSRDGAKWFTLTKTGQTELDTCRKTLSNTTAACTVVGQRCQLSPRDLAAIKLRMANAVDP